MIPGLPKELGPADMTKSNFSIPANENIFCVCARIIAVRQGRIDRSVLIAVRKVKPDAALRQKDRADAENVFVHGYNKRNAVDMPYCAPAVEIP